MNKSRKEKLFKKLEQNLEVQLFVSCEECGELIQAISKIRRKPTPEAFADLASEIADVRIMCEQLEYFFGLENAVSNQYDFKLLRLEERMKGDDDDSVCKDSEFRED